MNPRLLRRVSLVSAMRYLSDLLLVVRGLLLARLLGPSLFGVWSSMRLVLVFGRYAHLGSRTGMIQLGSHARSSGDSEGAGAYEATAWSLGVMLASLAAVALLLCALVLGAHIAAWALFAVAFVLAQLHDHQQAALFAEERAVAASLGWLVLALVSTLLGIWAAARFGLEGFLAALALAYVAALGAVQRRTVPRRPRVEARRAHELVQVGMPIMGAEALLILLLHVDKLMLWALAGTATLGFYTAQSYLSTWVMTFPASTVAIVYPRAVGALARGESVRIYVERGALGLALLACPALVVLHLGLHLPIRWLLPAYVESIEAGRWLALGMFFPVAAAVPGVCLIALGAQRRLCALRAIAVLATAVCVALGLRMGGMVGVAGGASLGFALAALLALREAMRRAGARADEWRTLAATLASLFVLLVLCTLAARAALPEQVDSLSEDLLQTACRCALALGLLLPPLLWSAQRTGVLAWLRETPVPRTAP